MGPSRARTTDATVMSAGFLASLNPPFWPLTATTYPDLLRSWNIRLKYFFEILSRSEIRASETGLPSPDMSARAHRARTPYLDLVESLIARLLTAVGSLPCLFTSAVTNMSVLLIYCETSIAAIVDCCPVSAADTSNALRYPPCGTGHLAYEGQANEQHHRQDERP